MGNSDQLSRALRPLWRRILLAVGRGVVTRADDSGNLERLQVRLLKDELRDGVDVLGHYGFASAAEPGAEALLVFLGGNRDAGVAVSVEDRSLRPTDLAPGEVRLYSRFGSSVRLLADGSVEVHPANGTVRISGDAIVAGDLQASGDVQDGDPAAIAKTVREIRVTFNAHVHPHGAGPGITGPPTPMI